MHFDMNHQTQGRRSFALETLQLSPTSRPPETLGLQRWNKTKTLNPLYSIAPIAHQRRTRASSRRHLHRFKIRVNEPSITTCSQPLPADGPPMSTPNLTTAILSQFPSREPCFGHSKLPECQNVTDTMVKFLNISDYDRYFQSYCLFPPDDSCEFGFCPNPDVASPTVRASTYFTTVMSAVLILYLPGEVASTFFSQLLNVYSLIIAAIIAVANRNLTKAHTGVAIGLACSPLSAYLILYVVRALFGYNSRLNQVFGPGMWIPRAAVLMLVPVWLTLLTLAAMPRSAWRFQQSACDEVVGNHRVLREFFEPVLIVARDKAVLPATIFIGVTWLVGWVTAVVRERKVIWKSGKGIFRPHRIWRKVVDRYPFIQFYTVIFIPHLVWIVNIESGVHKMLKHESFSYSYGQMLALLVTIPPLYQLILLVPRVFWWFFDLNWVRVILGRRDKPLHDPGHLRRTTTETLYDVDMRPLVASEAKTHGRELSSG
ncbi:hypothetical protein MKEN_00934300 [Mycena kentingensis (nom. inval.)]|nr:hypothetical protein MKEN_00934300 [Mycena kentingensis (nom. inval.)]